MNSKERVVNQATGKPVDRIPMLGGWNLGVDNICRLAGLTPEQYAKDPFAAVLQANRAMHVDGLILNPIVPQPGQDLRNMHLSQSSFDNVEPEAIQRDADGVPETEAEILRAYPAEENETRLRNHYRRFVQALGDMVAIPTHWDSIANFSLYSRYGYEAFLAAVALYPEAVEKLFWQSAIHARQQNIILLKLYREFDLPPVLFFGCDICTAQGPLVSPAFLKESYWPHARYSIEPLLEAGIRLVCHCDGNVMPIIPDIVDIGFSGFQGFQYEFGVDPYKIREHVKERPPLFFAGLSVSKTLPLGTVEDVRREVEYVMDYTRGGQGLFLFTSNVTGGDVPPENIRAAYAHQELLPPGTLTTSAWREWPWLAVERARTRSSGASNPEQPQSNR
jgi:hypothetical protein